jgi:hypothetical protein
MAKYIVKASEEKAKAVARAEAALKVKYEAKIQALMMEGGSNNANVAVTPAPAAKAPAATEPVAAAVAAATSASESIMSNASSAVVNPLEPATSVTSTPSASPVPYKASEQPVSTTTTLSAVVEDLTPIGGVVPPISSVKPLGPDGAYASSSATPARPVSVSTKKVAAVVAEEAVAPIGGVVPPISSVNPLGPDGLYANSARAPPQPVSPTKVAADTAALAAPTEVGGVSPPISSATPLGPDGVYANSSSARSTTSAAAAPASSAKIAVSGAHATPPIRESRPVTLSDPTPVVATTTASLYERGAAEVAKVQSQSESSGETLPTPTAAKAPAASEIKVSTFSRNTGESKYFTSASSGSAPHGFDWAL